MTASAKPSPRAFVTWAHGARDWTEEQRSQWEQAVVLFTSLLRRSGIDADMDAFRYSDNDIDWSRFGPASIRNSDVTLVALSRPWADRFEGRNDPTEGAGAVAEADELLGMFDKNQEQFRSKVKLVLLPGVEEDTIPDRLRTLQRFKVAELSPEGIEDLIRTLTDQPRYVAPPLGQVPDLSAHGQPELSNDQERRKRIQELYEELGALKQTLGRLPDPQPGEGPKLPWWRGRQRVLGRIQEIEMEVAELEKAHLTSSTRITKELAAALQAVIHELSATVRVLGLSIGNGSAMAVPTSDAMYREFRRDLALGLPPDLLEQVMNAYADMSILAERLRTIEPQATARGGALSNGEITVLGAFLDDLKRARGALVSFVSEQLSDGG